MTYQCHLCFSRFPETSWLRNHFRLSHDLEVDSKSMYWPEFTLIEIVRLCFYREQHALGRIRA